MHSIKIGQNKLLMDKSEYEFLKDKNIYLKFHGQIENYFYPALFLHTMFFKNISKGNVIDHINRNRLDCRRINLREVHENINKRNKRQKSNKRVKYFGVKINLRKKYAITLQFNNANFSLGTYDSAKEAAFIYDAVVLCVEPDRTIPFNFPINKFYNIDLISILEKALNKMNRLNKSGYYGVSYWPGKNNSYQAHIRHPKTKKSYYLGSFRTAMEASIYRENYIKKNKIQGARIYKDIKWFCEKAKINFKDIRRKISPIKINKKKYFIKTKKGKIICDKDVYKYLKDKRITIYTDNYPFVYLHHLPFHKREFKKGLLVDHIDRNRVNFQKSNLRLVTYTENNRNKRVSNRHGFQGIRKIKYGSFTARFRLNKKMLYIGSFKSKIEAAKCYDILNLIFHPDFEAFNFPPKTYKKLNFKKYLNDCIARKPKNNKSGFRGVSLVKKTGKYVAFFRVDNKKNKNIGVFSTKTKAAEAYDNFARKHSRRKILLNLNFITFSEWCKAYNISPKKINTRLRYLNNEFFERVDIESKI